MEVFTWLRDTEPFTIMKCETFFFFRPFLLWKQDTSICHKLCVVQILFNTSWKTTNEQISRSTFFLILHFRVHPALRWRPRSSSSSWLRVWDGACPSSTPTWGSSYPPRTLRTSASRWVTHHPQILTSSCQPGPMLSGRAPSSAGEDVTPWWTPPRPPPVGHRGRQQGAAAAGETGLDKPQLPVWTPWRTSLTACRSTMPQHRRFQAPVDLRRLCGREPRHTMACWTRWGRRRRRRRAGVGARRGCWTFGQQWKSWAAASAWKECVAHGGGTRGANRKWHGRAPGGRRRVWPHLPLQRDQTSTSVFSPRLRQGESVLHLCASASVTSKTRQGFMPHQVRPTHELLFGSEQHRPEQKWGDQRDKQVQRQDSSCISRRLLRLDLAGGKPKGRTEVRRTR